MNTVDKERTMVDSDVHIDLIKRSPILEVLHEGPLDQRTLERQVALSQSTSYRVIGWFIELGIIERSHQKFTLTPAGECVAETVATFKADVRTVLRDETIDSDLLIDFIRCSPVLEALREESLDRREIETQLSISSSTSHRYTRTLGERGLIVKASGRFDLMDSGERVADAAAAFTQGVETTLRLVPVVEAVCDTTAPCPIEAFADATITIPGHGDSYSHLKRFITLVEKTDTLRGMDLDSIAPFYINELTRPILDGMETEVIDPPDVLENR